MMLVNMLLKPGELALREVEKPPLGPGEVLVQVKTALTCGTDLKAYLRGHPQIPMPGPFGHEFSGVIAAVGEGVDKFQVGDAVLSVHSAPCGECYWCQREQGNLCPSVMESKVLGAFAEYVKVPKHIVEQNMFHKPPEVSFTTGALLEPLACVVYGLKQVRINRDDTVVIIGIGAVGLLFLLALQAQGVKRVILLGKRSYRLNMARRLGGWRVVDVEQEDPGPILREATEGRGADVVIECTGRVASWQQAVDLCRRGGQALLFGGCPQGTQVEFDTYRLHYDQISIHSPFHFNPQAVAEAFQMIKDGLIPGEELVSGSFSLDELEQVFELLQQGDCVKYAIVPGR